MHFVYDSQIEEGTRFVLRVVVSGLHHSLCALTAGVEENAKLDVFFSQKIEKFYAVVQADKRRQGKLPRTTVEVVGCLVNDQSSSRSVELTARASVPGRHQVNAEQVSGGSDSSSGSSSESDSDSESDSGSGLERGVIMQDLEKKKRAASNPSPARNLESAKKKTKVEDTDSVLRSFMIRRPLQAHELAEQYRMRTGAGFKDTVGQKITKYLKANPTLYMRTDRGWTKATFS